LIFAFSNALDKRVFFKQKSAIDLLNQPGFLSFVMMCVKAFSVGGLLICFAYTFCSYKEAATLSKKQKTFRFNDNLYGKFKQVCDTSHSTITDAFEQFMSNCVEAGKLVYPEKGTANYEIEARILVDWLGKGKLFYRGENGEEANIPGRLLWLIPRIASASLKREIEGTLKKSVKEPTD
jgi:hypothetical protein